LDFILPIQYVVGVCALPFTLPSLSLTYDVLQYSVEEIDAVVVSGRRRRLLDMYLLFTDYLMQVNEV
jgi:hypothetical protein